MIIEIENKPKYDLPFFEYNKVYSKKFEIPNEQLLLEPNSSGTQELRKL